MPPGFEFLEHTADIGVRARGRSVEEVFAEAARGLFHLMYDPERVTPRQERLIALHANGYEELLYDFLSEIIYLLDADKLAMADVEITELSPHDLRARVRGERFDPDRHDGRMHVKAVTLHQLNVEEREGEWTAVVYFDI